MTLNSNDLSIMKRLVGPLDEDTAVMVAVRRGSQKKCDLPYEL